MKRIKNPWVPSRSMSGGKINIPDVLVLALLSWSFYKIFSYGYDFITRKFSYPVHG